MFGRQDELLLTFLDINWALESAAWHRLKKKSPVIAQIRIYTTGISSSISPLSSNPFILEIVLTTVTGEIASRFTKERLQSFFFFSSSSSQEMITLTKFSPLVGVVRVTLEPLERIISLSILYLSLN